MFQHLTRDGAVNVGGKDVFHFYSQHPTKTVNLICDGFGCNDALKIRLLMNRVEWLTSLLEIC